MLNIIYFLVGLAVTHPHPEDYADAHELLNPNCHYTNIYDVIKQPMMVFEFNGFHHIIQSKIKKQRVYNAMKQVSIHLEIAGENDSWWVFTEIFELKERNKYFRNYPNPDKWNFTIDAHTIRKLKDSNFEYQRKISRRISSGLEQDRLDRLYAIKNEAQDLYIFWEKMLDLQNHKQYHFGTRKKMLIDIYEILGPENFYTGNYPPNVPNWIIDD